MLIALPGPMVKTTQDETNMLFFGYNFHKIWDGSLLMDDELSPETLGVKEGDIFTVVVRDNKVILQKQTNGHSRTDQ